MVPDIGSDLPCQELSSLGLLIWNFDLTDYTSERIPPNVYTFNFDVSTSAGREPSVTEEFSVQLVLPDPCDPPISLTKVAFENQRYTLTDTGQSYTHPDFSISPDYCPIDYTYE